MIDLERVEEREKIDEENYRTAHADDIAELEVEETTSGDATETTESADAEKSLREKIKDISKTHGWSVASIALAAAAVIATIYNAVVNKAIKPALKKTW